MLHRSLIEDRIRRSLRASPVTALLGPRQCGKTTLARQFLHSSRGGYFDLEDPVSLQRLSEPMTALRSLRGLIVIDEIQRRPDLFPLLRVLSDRRPLPARFLILGSASPELLQQSSETLAGRIAFLEIAGFDWSEAGPGKLRRLWWRGGFPRAFLARSDAESRAWQENFIQTFLERDIREFGTQVPALTLRRLWTMVAHYHGQIWNSSEVSRSLGESHTTVKRHLNLLTGALMVRQLQPWHENLGKRQVKAPKVYLRDSGLLHALLGVSSFHALEGHPKIGASWEGLVIEEVARIAGSRNVFFWATQSGAELDCLVMWKGQRWGVEVKYADAPGMTKSMHIAIEDLKLDRLLVVYPGSEPYQLDKRVRVLPIEQLPREFGGSIATTPLQRAAGGKRAVGAIT
ncbi:MAG: ATP-binding protein [Acidobacteriia bacterium]|nr:ATP-binding protein [Terriglobia bacterium]